MIRKRKEEEILEAVRFKVNDTIDNNYSKKVRKYTDFIYPSGISTLEPGYIIIDGSYTACLLCCNLPYQVPKTFLDDLINFKEGVEIYLKQRPVNNKAELIRDITQYLGFTKFKMNTGGEDQVDSGLQENALSHSKYIKKRLAEGDDFWFISLFIVVSADSSSNLDVKLKSVEGLLSGKDIFYKRADFRQLEAFLCTLPVGRQNQRMLDQTERNILSSGLCGFYPFTASSLSDPEGMLMGINQHDNGQVIIDIFDTMKYNNANMIILGGSGSGKTFTSQMFTGRFRMQKIPVMMICPLKGYEYRPLCENVGGNYFKICAGSKNTINMFDIRPVKNLENNDVSWLASKIQKLKINFSLMFPDISERELKLISTILKSVYEKKGITLDNASLFRQASESDFVSLTPQLKEMPVLADVQQEMFKSDELKKRAEEMEEFVTGSLSCFNGKTNIDLDNLYNVADISELDNPLIPLAMFMITDIYMDRIKADITQKKVLLLDEIWRLMKNLLSAEFVLEVFKTIRGYGGSAIGATQDIVDFFALEDGLYGKGIINNSQIKIVLRLETNAAKEVGPVLNLSEEEMIKVENFGRGNGLLYAGDNHLAMAFTPFETEHKLITTDRKEILRYRKEV
ncbi:MAG: hypothetical protein PHE79_11635 [Eubacteriales bacterium]|nr:hypothetical protein [Eubacteriales bacterium]